MPGMDGMAVAHTLASRSSRPALIFVTAFDRFAVAAFDVAAVDYLLKPVEVERLERAIAPHPRPDQANGAIAIVAMDSTVLGAAPCGNPPHRGSGYRSD